MYLDPVKNSNKLKILARSNLGETITENFNFTKTISEVSNDTILASEIDSFARNFINNLTTSSYNDCTIITVKCLESIAGGES